jgi:hypothetical protein
MHMPTTNPAFDRVRKAIEERMAEIDEERVRLERAHAALGDGKPRRRPGRPRGRKPTADQESASPPRRRRKRRGGTRGDQAVELITRQPGIGASDVAKAMKMKPNYLYRVLGDLEKEGRVKKQGHQYFPAT